MSDAARIATLETQVHELERLVKALTKRVDALEKPRKPLGTDAGKQMREVIVTKRRG